MQAATSTAGQAIERQFKNTTPRCPDAPEHGDHGGQDGHNPDAGQQPDPNTGLFASVSWLAVLLGRITDPPPLSGIYLGQDGWSRPATSGRPMSGMGSS